MSSNPTENNALGLHSIIIKGIWERYTDQKKLDALVSELDEFFVDNDLYHEIEEEKEESPLKVIKEEDIQLVCYEWFKSE